MGAAGELPDRQRVPEIEGEAFERQAAAPEQHGERQHRRGLEAEHAEPHRQDIVAEARDGEEDELRERGVDRRRAIEPIDVRIDGLVAQRDERRIGRARGDRG